MTDLQPPQRQPFEAPPPQPVEGLPPQPVEGPGTHDVEQVPQVGELTPMWTIAIAATWAMVFMSYMAVWKASEELGIGTWWLGPRSNPQPIVVNLIPFVIAALMSVAAGIRFQRLSWISLAGSATLVLIAIPDLSRSTGLAAIEFAIAGAVMIVSLVSFTGRYRKGPEAAAAAGR